MQIVLEGVHVQGRRGPLLQLDGLSLATGGCVLLAGEPGQGHTALALVLTGRLAPFTGRVRLIRDDGSESVDRKELRRLTAVVDLPSVSEPDEEVRVGSVTGEDLSLARHPVWPGTPGRWLAKHRLASLERSRVDALPVPLRTELLTALAVERNHVRFLVLALPDRHGGHPSQWWAIARAYAAAGYGVLVQCGRSSARDLGARLPPAEGGSDQRATPVEALRVPPDLEPPQPEDTTAATTDTVDTNWLFGTSPAGDQQQEPEAPPWREQEE